MKFLLASLSISCRPVIGKFRFDICLLFLDGTIFSANCRMGACHSAPIREITVKPFGGKACGRLFGDVMLNWKCADRD